MKKIVTTAFIIFGKYMHDSGTVVTIVTGRITDDLVEQNGYSKDKAWTKRSIAVAVGKFNETECKYFDTKYIVSIFHNSEGSNFYYDQLKDLKKGMLVQVIGEMRTRAYLNKHNEARCSREFGKSKITVINANIPEQATERVEVAQRSSEEDEIPF